MFSSVFCFGLRLLEQFGVVVFSERFAFADAGAFSCVLELVFSVCGGSQLEWVECAD